MIKPKVSIVVPVYKVEKYLDRCVQSLLNQTMKDIEIILVDDGSPDNCPAMCDDYSQKDARVKVIHKKNAGLGMACNSGIEVAQGEYIAFCDSDDWVDPEMYEAMYNTSISYNADMVITGLRRADESGNILGYLPHPQKFEIHNRNNISHLMKDLIAAKPNERLDRRIQVSAKTILYNRDLIDANELRFVSEREYPSEDLIFNITVLKHVSCVCILPDVFYNYFVNTTSISTTVKPKQFEKICKTATLISKIINEPTPISCQTDPDNIYYRICRFLIGESRTCSKQIINSTLSEFEKRNELSNITNNLKLKKIVDNYPLSKMPFIHRLALTSLIHNRYFILNLLLKKYK